MFGTRADWEAQVTGAGGVFEDVVDTQWGDAYATLGAGTSIDLPFGSKTLAFNVDLYGAQVPLDWPGWGGVGTPRVLWTPGDSITATVVGGSLTSFGLEMQPGTFLSIELKLWLSDAPGESLTQFVSGDAEEGGALFFGWTDLSVNAFTISMLTNPDLDSPGFAFGRMVEGSGSGGTPTTPEGGSLFLISGLLWTGLLGWKKWRNRA